MFRRVLCHEQRVQLILEPPQNLQPFECRLHHLLLVLKHLPAVFLDQHPDRFPHAPARLSQDLPAIHAGYEQRDATIAHDADALGEAIEGLEFEAGKINSLQLLGEVHRNQASSYEP